VISIVLADPAGEPLPAWDPGAHINVKLPSGDERQYSLCGDPADRARWRIGVLRETAGRGGSAWLHSSLAVGDRVPVDGPRNHFELAEAERYLFIAGGIGITPLLPMISRVAARGADWELLYGGRRRDSMAFLDEIASHGGAVTLWPQDTHGLLDLDAFLATPRAGTAIYCCGPEPLISAVEERCSAWHAGALHVERFSPKPGALDGENTAFEVVLETTGITIAVGREESIVDALSAAGVAVRTSCREGTCGTCETGVVDGEPDHRDSFLTEEEREGNDTMMVCCSRARSDRLVLDL
jgi:ferredoxin-NADP reductase